MKQKDASKHVVVIGGGTGTYTLLQGFKQHADEVFISKIVSMADSGGSTGRLRDEMGQLPVGDARMGLAALAADDGESDQLLRELFLYRFDRGVGLSGHNFGNLFLSALTDILGSEAKAIKAASQLLRIRGEVLPVTEDNLHLIATYDDGVEAVGEHDIDEPNEERENHRIVSLRTNKPGHVTDDADRAIREADIIVLGPGDLYASLLASCIVGGVPEAIRASKGKFCYVTNLMSRPGQTRGMRVSDYIEEINHYVGQRPDTVIVNTTPLPQEALARYEKEGDFPVVDDLQNGMDIQRGDFISSELVTKQGSDVLVRSLIRHDGTKLAEAVLKLLE